MGDHLPRQAAVKVTVTRPFPTPPPPTTCAVPGGPNPFPPPPFRWRRNTAAVYAGLDASIVPPAASSARPHPLLEILPTGPLLPP